jgi:hypothetical protein
MNWTHAPETLASVLASLDREAEQAELLELLAIASHGRVLPRWIARSRYPLTEGATRHPAGVDLTHQK